MLNLFNAIVNGIGRALPNYTQGYRTAIQDNWNDLKNYNDIQQGQISNAFLEDTFPLAYNMYADRANNSRLGAMLNTANYLADVPTWNGRIQAGSILGANYPRLMEGAIANMFNNWDTNNMMRSQIMNGGFTMPNVQYPQLPYDPSLLPYYGQQPQVQQQNPRSILEQSRQAPSAAVQP